MLHVASFPHCLTQALSDGTRHGKQTECACVCILLHSLTVADSHYNVHGVARCPFPDLTRISSCIQTRDISQAQIAVHHFTVYDCLKMLEQRCE